MPTGVAIRDVRERLFAAAERVLVRDGSSALTSRAVTEEAGCSKGVLHRHFADFDDFLVELVGDRIARIGVQSVALRESAGSASVVENLIGAVTTLFEPVALGVVSLVTSRDELRSRLRQAGLAGVPVLGEAATMIAAYLNVESGLGRVRADADLQTLALTLIGAGHLMFAGREAAAPVPAEVRKVVASVMEGALQETRRATVQSRVRAGRIRRR